MRVFNPVLGSKHQDITALQTGRYLRERPGSEKI
jgi:hypothetical protein